jgi:hypothetical protein
MLKRIISGDQSGAGWGDLQGFPLNRQAKVGTEWVQTHATRHSPKKKNLRKFHVTY